MKNSMIAIALVVFVLAVYALPAPALADEGKESEGIKRPYSEVRVELYMTEW